MKGVAEYVEDENIDCSIFKAGGDKTDPIFERDNVSYVGSVTKFTPREACCFGGTAWAFSNEHVKESFDYLFIDEAGQVSRHPSRRERYVYFRLPSRRACHHSR